MKSIFVPLDNESGHKDTALSLFSSMFKVSDFIAVINEVFPERGINALSETLKSRGRGEIPLGKRGYEWFRDGINCEILSPSAKSWQRGKVRIKVSLEFCPDEPEISKIPESGKPENGRSNSSLDDIRQMQTRDGQLETGDQNG